MNPLTIQNVKEGILIINNNNPSWGTFVIQNKYDDGIWNIRGGSGSRILSEGEFKFWSIA